jgi:hypothetical protein
VPFLALAVCALLLSGSQGTAVVRGRVVDARTHAPVADARLLLTPTEPDGAPRTEGAVTAQSDTDGRFEFVKLAPGPYTLAVTTIGYRYVRRTVFAAEPPVADLTIPLAEGAGPYVEDVTVVAAADRQEPGGATGVLGPAALQDLRGVATDDPMRAVQALPGVATGDDFQAGFSVRGSAFRHTGVTIDGVPAAALLHVVRAEANSGSISMINTDVVSRAALLVGARPSREGDWLGPTLAFDLREGSRDRSGIRVAVSGTAASLAVEGPLLRDRRGSWLVSLRKSYLDWLVRKVEADFDSTIGFWDGHAKGVLDLSDRQTVDVLVIGGDASYRDRETASPNSLLRARSGSTLAAVRWSHRGSRALQSHRAFFLGTEFRNTGGRGQELVRGYTQEAGWRGDVTMPVANHWLLAAGGSIEHLRAGHLARRYGDGNAGNLLPTDVRSGRFSARTASAWADATRSTGGVNVNVGIRATSRADIEGVSWSPWAGLDRRIGRFTWRAAAGGVVQLPDPLAVFETFPRRPERAGLLDAGLSHEVTRTMTWSVNAFMRREWNVWRSEDDRIDAVTGERVFAPVFPVSQATLDSRARGVDLIVRRQAPARFAGWVGYTWARARAADRVTGERFDADFDQRHTLNVVVSERLSYRSSIGMKLRVGSNTPLVGYFEPSPEGLRLSTRRNAVRLPTYARLDARLTRTFTLSNRRLTLFIEVMNVLGRENVGPADPSVRASLQVTGFAERLIPRVPSAGFAVEF